VLNSASCLRAADSRPELQLFASDAEVWAFHARVDGALLGSAELSACRVEVGARAFPAQTQAGRLHAEVELSAGPNTLRAVCSTRDGQALRSQPVRYWVRLRAGPIARASARLTIGQLTLDARLSSASESQPAKLVDYAWFADDAPIAHGELCTIAAPTAPGRHQYELRVTDARGRSDRARAEVAIAPLGTPAWPDDAIVYGVMPPAFGPAGLPDVTAALASLAELGVDTLWLSPVFEAPAHDFGYAVTDYFHVRAEYGGDSALTALIREAHRLQLRVLLDLPANHTSREHRYFIQQAAQGRRSHYYGFYARDRRGQPTHYFDWDNLFNLDYHNPEVARFMLEVGEHWVRDFDVDGYRIDAAWGVRERDPEFWPRFAAALHRVQPEALLIAEASVRDPYYLSHGFDIAYDWGQELGHPAWERVFDSEFGIPRRLQAALEAAPGGRALRFLNNNDTGKRFITRHGEALTRVATAALLTLPGIPCLYTFDEVGAEFEPYITLHPLRTQNAALREFHERWIGLRRTQPALSGAGFEPVFVGDELYAYLRSSADQVLLVLLNFSNRAVERNLALPDSRRNTAAWRDLQSGAELAQRDRRLRVKLAPWQARALTPIAPRP
jgi:cyclomaltodextrinase / maltogenic alpha-amylase / neopullulanase